MVSIVLRQMGIEAPVHALEVEASAFPVLKHNRADQRHPAGFL